VKEEVLYLHSTTMMVVVEQQLIVNLLLRVHYSLFGVKVGVAIEVPFEDD